MGDKQILTPEVMSHYRNAQPTPEARAANAALPGYIVGASEWLQSIWGDRDTFVDKPSLILWGAKDIAFRTKELERWKSELSQCEAHVFADCGAFRRGGSAGQGASTASTMDVSIQLRNQIAQEALTP